MTAALLALALLAGPPDGGVETGPAAVPSEDAIREAMREHRPLTARRLAEERLRSDPDSIVATFALGLVCWHEEGDLSRAASYLERAEALYEQRYPRPSESEPWRLQLAVLRAQIDLDAVLDESARRLQRIERFNRLFSPDLVAERAWPLMKLGRVVEARRAATAGLASTDREERMEALTTLCAIESQTEPGGLPRPPGPREGGLAACRKALEEERAWTQEAAAAKPASAAVVPIQAAKPASAAVVPIQGLLNAAEAAWSALRPAEAEALAREATGGAHGLANPWELLAALYTNQARTGEAVDALLDMQRWRLRQPAALRDHRRATLEGTLAAFLLVVGESAKGLEVIDRAVAYPDRTGLLSTTERQAGGGHAALRLALTRAERTRREEEAATRGWLARAGQALASGLARVRDASDRATLASALSDQRYLRETFRLYLEGSLAIPSWLMGDLVEHLGAGVVLVAIEQARAAEELAALGPYYDALEAEARLALDQPEAALRLARAALAALPPSEPLLRGRTAAVGAEAARRAGAHAASLELFAAAMQADPGAVLRLGFALPAAVAVEGSDPAAREAGLMLARSPRLRRERGAFVVRVSGADRLTICLSDPAGSRLACATEPHPARGAAPLTVEERARAAVLEFTRRAFSLPVLRPSWDPASLDGTGVVRAEADRARIDRILGEGEGGGAP